MEKSPDKRESLEESVTGEPSWLQRVREAAGSSGSTSVPESVFRAARVAFLERRKNPDRTIHVARLLFDSWTHLAPSALRGPGELSYPSGDSARHQIFSTAWHDVDLYGERLGGDLWYLIGQVLPRSEGEAIRPLQAVLSSGEKTVYTGVPENGEFHIPSVRPGIYELRLRLDRAEVLLPNVRVGV